MTTKNIQDVVTERVEEFEKSLAETLKLWTDDAQAETTASWYANTLTQLVKEVEAGERNKEINAELLRSLRLANDEVTKTNFGRVEQHLLVADKCIQALTH